MKIDKLPIDNYLPQIHRGIANHSSLIVEAPPGTGKTTRIPPFLSNYFDGTIILLQPRRVAVKATVERIADENLWAVGEQVGYQMRGDSQFSEETKLLVMTEGVLSQYFNRDSQLSGISCIILDEFHERSVHTDFAISWIRYLQQSSRPDLKLIVISATMDSLSISNYLGGAPIVKCELEIFPLEEEYSGFSFNIHSKIELRNRMLMLTMKAWGDSRIAGDILVFLPSISDVEFLVRELLKKNISRMKVFSLHSRLNVEQQMMALQRYEDRKIVVATNIAETSLTVNGVQAVVDSGLENVSSFHPDSGVKSISLQRISKASARQRSGRSNRQGHGFCFKAWTQAEERLLKEYLAPQVERTDLVDTIAYLKNLGIDDLKSWNWFSCPPDRSLEHAIRALQCMEAIDTNGFITERGKQLVQFSGGIRVAQIVYEAMIYNRLKVGSLVAAILQERDFFKADITQLDVYEHCNCDITLRLQVLDDIQNFSSNEVDFRVIEKIRKTSKMFEAQAKASFQKDRLPKANLQIDASASFFVFNAYGDQLTRRREKHRNRGRMLGGRGIELERTSCVKKGDLFISLNPTNLGPNSRESRVSLASEVLPKWIELVHGTWLKIESWVEEKKNEAPKAYRAKMFWDVPIEQPQKVPLDLAVKNEFLIKNIFEKWEGTVKQFPEIIDWIGRVRFVASVYPDMNWPTLNEENLKEALQFYANENSEIEKWKGDHFVEAFSNLLSMEQMPVLETQAPKFVQISGFRFPVSIDYSNPNQPFITAKIQNLFGLKKLPLIGENKELSVVVLAPNKKPIELAPNLDRFWQTSYPIIRKEMRSRYPRHSWPENPLDAEPEFK